MHARALRVSVEPLVKCKSFYPLAKSRPLFFMLINFEIEDNSRAQILKCKNVNTDILRVSVERDTHFKK